MQLCKHSTMILLNKSNNVFTRSWCGADAVARGLCSKHYQQHVRGKLGTTRSPAAKGQGAEIKVSVTKQVKSKLTRQARKEKISLSALCARALNASISE